MHPQFSVNTRERSSPPDSFGTPSTIDPIGPPPSRPAYQDSYNDSPLSDSYFPPLLDERPRTLSSGPYGPPALITAPPLSQYPSQYNKRSRRSSTSAAYGPPIDSFRRIGGTHIKFRVKGSYHPGVTLGEAMGNVRLSSSSAYTFHELNTDSRGRLTLRVRWGGYRSLTYEIPVSGYEDGRYVNLQSLARRISRAIVHFLTTNAIAIPWDRVVLHRLEETSLGVWVPVLTTN
ncbi:hypothetical protein BV25DRAFT_1791661 [Artomyces pyxidatus]|uniref:Uncharacterized protein n=1 Tax=Artomyces pyxidatus TaxID=48021 RepID=A0ACB8TL47_9AGAM|nr:hypothetical protein BV25DRAFT_1791661 [Artomyces pyxidatus]